MIYRHTFFTLDTDSRLVTDENGKELRLTGNAYRVLVFLCANTNATLTQLGDFLDHAKDFDENHIRQYRYKINTIVGHDVIEYRNGVYSLSGSIEKADKIAENNRNTVLLQSDSVSSDRHNEPTPTSKKMKPSLIPAIISATLLALSFLSWPSAYYSILRIVVTLVAVYYAYVGYKQLNQKGGWFWCLVAIAILFNPILPVYLHDKSLWSGIDIASAIVLVIITLRYRKSLKTT